MWPAQVAVVIREMGPRTNTDQAMEHWQQVIVCVVIPDFNHGHGPMDSSITNDGSYIIGLDLLP